MTDRQIGRDIETERERERERETERQRERKLLDERKRRIPIQGRRTEFFVTRTGNKITA